MDKTLDPAPFYRYTESPNDCTNLQDALELASDYHRGITWPKDWEEELWLIHHMMMRFHRRWGIELFTHVATNDLLARCSF